MFYECFTIPCCLHGTNRESETRLKRNFSLGQRFDLFDNNNLCFVSQRCVYRAAVDHSLPSLHTWWQSSVVSENMVAQEQQQERLDT